MIRYGAVVDGLEPMEEYKFAVILSNAAGPSHRSRSSEAVSAPFSNVLYIIYLLKFLMCYISCVCCSFQCVIYHISAVISNVIYMIYLIYHT